VAATPQQISRLFGWVASDVSRLSERLEREGRLCTGARIEGLKGQHLVSLHAT
jgi:hypothetical protein